MSNHNPPKPKKLGRDYTLADALGDKYPDFNKRMELNEPKSVIARAIGISRTTMDKYARIWEEEKLDRT